VALIIMLAIIMLIVMAVGVEWLLAQILPSMILRFQSVCMISLVRESLHQSAHLSYIGGVPKSVLLEREQLTRLAFPRVLLLLPRQR
jgi:hypothetical protein